MDFSKASAIYAGNKPVSAVYLGTQKIWPKLPYTPLQYVQFDGATYIDTGIAAPAASQPYNVSASITAGAVPTAATAIFGVNATGGWEATLRAPLGSTAFNQRFGTYVLGVPTVTYTAGSPYAIALTGLTLAATNVATGVTGNITGSASNITAGGNIWIGAGRTASGKFIGQMSSFQIASGGTLLCDMIPASMNGVVGMWDRARNQFYPPTQGVLTPPPQWVTDNPGLEQIDSVFFNGQSGIDTGIDQLGTPSIFCDFALTSLTANTQFYMPFGTRASPNNGDTLLAVANTTSSRFIYQYGQTMQANTLGTIVVAATRYTIQTTGPTATVTRLSNNNTGTATATAAAPTVPGNLWLGCAHDAGATPPGPIAGSMLVGQIYAFQISKAGALLCDMIPARKNGITGMWDRARNQFYPPTVGTLTGA